MRDRESQMNGRQKHDVYLLTALECVNVKAKRLRSPIPVSDRSRVPHCRKEIIKISYILARLGSCPTSSLRLPLPRFSPGKPPRVSRLRPCGQPCSSSRSQPSVSADRPTQGSYLVTEQTRSEKENKKGRCLPHIHVHTTTKRRFRHLWRERGEAPHQMSVVGGENGTCVWPR